MAAGKRGERSRMVGEHASLALWKRAVVWIGMGYLPVYLGWRAWFTFNPQHPAYSALFLAAEVIGALSTLNYFWSAYRLRERTAPELRSKPTVDVFIPTLNEDLDLLANTIHHCLAMEYPHETYVLDDGRRPEVKELAHRLGARYLTREKNVHAKAGNLNHGLANSQGDLVAVLDADGIPRIDFLTELLGYFDDPKVALVQVPQTFYNLDSFQHSNGRGENAQIWEEQGLFFDVLEAGRDWHEAAMSCGSGSITRRSALDQIGGFGTGTLTEDLDTTLQLHLAGYKSVYHNEPLAFSLAPANLEGFVTQRARWATGAIQILRKDFFALFGFSRLTLIQRFLYLPFYYLTPIQRVFYVLAPPLYIWLGIAPLAGPDWILIPMATNMALSLAVYYILGRGRSRLILTEIFFLYTLWPYLKSIVVGLVPFANLRFRVTSKRAGRARSVGLLVPIVVVMGITLFGVGGGLAMIGAGHSEPGLIFTLACSIFQGLICAAALVRSGKGAFWDEAYSFFDPRPVRVILVNGAISIGPRLGIASVISERRIRFHLTHSLDPGNQIGIEVDLPGSVLPLAGEVMECTKVPRPGGGSDLYMIDLKLQEFSHEQRMKLMGYFFGDATPAMLSKHGRRSRLGFGRFRDRRQHQRFSMLLPVVITHGTASDIHPIRTGVLTDLSVRGANVSNPIPIEPGTQVKLWLPWQSQMIGAKVVRCIHEHEGSQHRYEVGLEFDEKLTLNPSQLNRKQHLAKVLPTG